MSPLIESITSGTAGMSIEPAAFQPVSLPPFAIPQPTTTAFAANNGEAGPTQTGTAIASKRQVFANFNASVGLS